MNFKYFSLNGKIIPAEKAVIPLSNVEYLYGFGVYESIRVTNTVPYFLKNHVERLMESARIIGLEHKFSEEFVSDAIAELVEKNKAETCNLKILLLGGGSKESATLYILCLNPLFPDKKLYRDGVHCITYPMERMLPHAKTLNMLGSYLAYRKAKEANAYDALLLNRDGNIIEGTRTNFFCIKDKRIVSPPENDILLGVTRYALIKTALAHGYTLEEKNIAPRELESYDGAFITSTSSKILPLRSIDNISMDVSSPHLRELMSLFDTFLKDSKGVST